MRPTLILNPVADRDFIAFAEQQLDAGVSTVQEFERRLRVRYPRAAVRARELSGERTTVWYVYREGRWEKASADG